MQDKGDAERFRQLAHCLIQHTPQFTPDETVRVFGCRGGLGVRLDLTPPRRLGPGAQGSSRGNAVQPGAEGLGPLQGAGLACQEQEGGLEAVLRGVPVMQDAAAGGQHHWTVASHQGGEGGLIAAGGEVRQELGVGQVGRTRGGDVLDEAAEGVSGCGRHPWAPSGPSWPTEETVAGASYVFSFSWWRRPSSRKRRI
jgi:hypothetical protein